MGTIYHGDSAARRGRLNNFSSTGKFVRSICRVADKRQFGNHRKAVDKNDLRMLDNHASISSNMRLATKAFHRGGLKMNREMMAHHIAILEDIERKQASLREQMNGLEAVKRYHMREIELYKMVHPDDDAEPPVNPASQLYGKTMAEACEVALLKLGIPARVADVADLLATLFDYGEGSKNRSYVNALYNAMARKPNTFFNADGMWMVRRATGPPAEVNRSRGFIQQKPK
jgi:hypothetical protein